MFFAGMVCDVQEEPPSLEVTAEPSPTATHFVMLVHATASRVGCPEIKVPWLQLVPLSEVTPATP